MKAMKLQPDVTTNQNHFFFKIPDEVLHFRASSENMQRKEVPSTPVRYFNNSHDLSSISHITNPSMTLNQESRVSSNLHNQNDKQEGKERPGRQKSECRSSKKKRQTINDQNDRLATIHEKMNSTRVSSPVGSRMNFPLISSFSTNNFIEPPISEFNSMMSKGKSPKAPIPIDGNNKHRLTYSRSENKITCVQDRLLLYQIEVEQNKQERREQLAKQEIKELRATPSINEKSRNMVKSSAVFAKNPTFVSRLQCYSKSKNENMEKLLTIENENIRRTIQGSPKVTRSASRLKRTREDLMDWERARQEKILDKKAEQLMRDKRREKQLTKTSSFVCEGSKRILSRRDPSCHSPVAERLYEGGMKAREKLTRTTQEEETRCRLAKPHINNNTDLLLRQSFFRMANTTFCDEPNNFSGDSQNFQRAKGSALLLSGDRESVSTRMCPGIRDQSTSPNRLPCSIYSQKPPLTLLTTNVNNASTMNKTPNKVPKSGKELLSKGCNTKSPKEYCDPSSPKTMFLSTRSSGRMNNYTGTTTRRSDVQQTSGVSYIQLFEKRKRDLETYMS